MDLSNYSQSEVGHVINVGNFNKLNNLIQTFGADYNPSAGILTLVELRKKHNACNTHVGIVHQKTNADNANINDRQNAFAAADKLATRVFNAFVAVAEDEKDIEDIQRFIDKLRGTPAMPETREDEEGQEIKEARSNSQQSFINRADHFRALVQFVQAKPAYNPNETDLKVPALKAVLEDLVMWNNNTSISEKELEKAIIERDLALYHEKEGLFIISKRVKRYIKSVFGADSEQFAQARAIKFTGRRKK